MEDPGGPVLIRGTATYCDDRDGVVAQIDPVTVVARLHYHSFLPSSPESGETGWESAANHLDHHGWNDEKNKGQYFRQNNGCVQGEISLADSNPVGSGIEQFHARGHTQSGVQDPYHPTKFPWEYQNIGARVTAMTPHYDESTADLFPPYSSCNLIDHYVEEDYDPEPDQFWSGFDRGREELVSGWIATDHHRMVESQFWDNTNPQLQCNGDETRHSGYVYHVGLCEVAYPC